MSDAKVREGLKQCNLCNVALVSAIKERVDKGEDVNAVCRDYERYQEQLGEVFYSFSALKNRFYREHPPLVRNGPVSANNTKLQRKREKSKSLTSNAISTIMDVGRRERREATENIDRQLLKKAVAEANEDTNARINVSETLNAAIHEALGEIDAVLNSWITTEYDFFLDTDVILIALNNLKEKVERHAEKKK